MLTADKYLITQRIEAHLRELGWQTHPDRILSGTIGWHGIAQHPSSNLVVCCWLSAQHAARVSERAVKQQALSPGACCPICEGNKREPDGWTLADAQASPEGYFAARNPRGQAPRWFSPNVTAFTADGHEKCRRCAGRGYLIASQETVVHTWPYVRATPTDAHWHIQRGKQITSSGTFPFACAVEQPTIWQPAIAAAVEAFQPAPEAAIVSITQPSLPPKHHVEIRGSWLWFQPITPLSPRAIRIISVHGAKAANRHPGWYYFKDATAMPVEQLRALA